MTPQELLKVLPPKKPCILKTEYPELGKLKAYFEDWYKEIGYNQALEDVETALLSLPSVEGATDIRAILNNLYRDGGSSNINRLKQAEKEIIEYFSVDEEWLFEEFKRVKYSARLTRNDAKELADALLGKIPTPKKG